MSDSYLSMATAADDYTMQRRVAAAAAQQGAPGDAWAWSLTNKYEWASAPGWGAAWDSAVAGGVPDPGADPAVISDAMILAQVQAMLGAG